MTLRFDGKVVIVTGAGGGLGRSHALEFAKRGASVVVNDLGGDIKGQTGASSRPADLVVDEIRRAGGKAVANYDSVVDGDKIVKTAIDSFGRIDIVVNNAGILRDVSYHKMTEKDWDLIYQVHTLGAHRVTRAAWPYFREQKFGRVINTSSASGLYGNRGQVNYASAKLGLVGFTMALAKEGERRGIFANAIAPIAGSRMTETVWPKDIVDLLKPEFVTPLVIYLAHPSTKENGSYFEVGGGWVGKVQIARAAGEFFDIDKISPEKLASGWNKVTDMTNSTFPDVAPMELVMGHLSNKLAKL